MAVLVEGKNIGDRATPQWTFTVDGTATDPTQIVVSQQDADGAESTITTASSPATLTTSSTPLARVSAGVFKLNPGTSLTEQGYWLFRAVSTGTAEAGPPDFVYKVGPSEFVSDAGLSAQALVGLQEAKDWLQQQSIETGDELELVRVINAMSERFIEEADGREFKRFDSTSSATARSFAPNGYNAIRIGDLSTAPTLVRIIDKDGSARATVAAADYITYPRNRRPWQPITHLEITRDSISPYVTDTVEVTGVWGFPSVPQSVKQAVLDAIAQIMDRDVEHYSEDLGPQQTGQGTNVIVFAGRPQLLSLPPSTLAVARTYRDPLAA